LHVPYTFFPDEAGGTEVYVARLVAAMRDRGFEGMVAAPGDRDCAYEYEGIDVHRFKKAPQSRFGYAYGEPDEVAAESFRALLRRIQPDIVHLHANTSAVSERIVDAAHGAGANAVFTYHTPAVSCLRGTMMHMGNTPCDGALNVSRCTVCTLQKHGVPAWFGNILSRVPVGLGRGMANSGLAGDVVTALRMTELAAEVHARFRSLMQKIDCVVVVCQWAMDALIANGVPRSKLVLCRQGVAGARVLPGDARIPNRRDSDNRPLRLSYFGRIDRAKGLDIVIEALNRIPNVPVTLNVHGILQPGSDLYAAKLKNAAGPRVYFRDALPPDAVSHAMADSDFIVVPSRCLETGPLVVYEAFAVGTPVVGAHLGGIAELVTDEVDGVLVGPNDSQTWAQTISELAADRPRVERLKSGVRPPRTMANVADEMAAHYRSLLGVNA
jgi:glycosyltransferase involved in cell wall biosynthesis